MDQLFAACKALVPRSFHRSSRIQGLGRIGNSNAFLCRDDELSFGVSGTKWRKFSFLLEVLRDTNAGTVCIGGFGSNSIAATSQLFTEHSIPTYALLRGERPEAKDAWHRFSGNRLITMLCLEPSAVKWQPRDRWHEAEGAAIEWACELEKKLNRPVVVLPEGGSCGAAVPGLALLWRDLMWRERMDLPRTGGPRYFKNIIMDAGSGLSASVMLLFMAMDYNEAFHFAAPRSGQETRKLHVVDVTGENTAESIVSGAIKAWNVLAAIAEKAEAEERGSTSPFIESESDLRNWLRPWRQFERPEDGIPGWMPNQPDETTLTSMVQVHRPEVGKSYGAINEEIASRVVEYARRWGILTDPMYMVKTMMTAERILADEDFDLDIDGMEELPNGVILHSGGSMGLFGRGHEILKLGRVLESWSMPNSA